MKRVKKRAPNRGLCVCWKIYLLGSSKAEIKASICFFNASFLSQSSGMCAVICSHSSGEKFMETGTHPGSAGGAINFSIVARNLLGIGLCTLPSQLSTVRLCTCSFSASSARVVPDKLSHSCSRSFNIASEKYNKMHTL